MNPSRTAPARRRPHIAPTQRCGIGWLSPFRRTDATPDTTGPSIPFNHRPVRRVPGGTLLKGLFVLTGLNFVGVVLTVYAIRAIRPTSLELDVRLTSLIRFRAKVQRDSMKAGPEGQDPVEGNTPGSGHLHPDGDGDRKIRHANSPRITGWRHSGRNQGIR